MPSISRLFSSGGEVDVSQKSGAFGPVFSRLVTSYPREVKGMCTNFGIESKIIQWPMILRGVSVSAPAVTVWRYCVSVHHLQGFQGPPL